MRVIFKKIFLKLYKIYFLYKRKKQATLLGNPFLTDPLVFHPTLLISTKVFVKYLLQLDLKNKKILDMGTGSGAIGIFAAINGASVIAADINPSAVELTKKNAVLNNVSITVYLSDLFNNIPANKLDYIFFNIPFYPKNASTLFEKAFNAGENYETVQKFSTQAINYLAPDGQLIIIFNEDSDKEKIVSFFVKDGYEIIDIQKPIRYFEQLFIYSFKKN